MKKHVLLLLSTMLLLSACANDNSSKGSSTSSSETPASSTTSTPAEPAKIDVTIKTTASGIEEYSGSHSKLYINSNFESSDWTTHVMTQDSTNEDVWTYTFSQVEVDSRFKFNIYYGGDEEADWSNGINKEGSGAEPRSITIEENKSIYEFDSTFVVPSTSHTFSLILTPHVQTTEGKDDTMFDSTYLWMWCSTANAACLEKQSDGTWKYEVEEYVGTVYQITPCLGSKSAMDWKYQHGAYEDGTWAPWNAIDITLEEGQTSYSYDIYFNSQPAEITGATYSITRHYNATSWTNLGDKIEVCYSVNDDSGNYNWLKMEYDKQANYNYTIKASDIPDGATVKYHLYSWISKDDEGNVDIRYLAKDATGTDFEITVSKDLEFILNGEFGTSAGAYGVGTVTTVE